FLALCIKLQVSAKGAHEGGSGRPPHFPVRFSGFRRLFRRGILQLKIELLNEDRHFLAILLLGDTLTEISNALFIACHGFLPRRKVLKRRAFHLYLPSDSLSWEYFIRSASRRNTPTCARV